MAEESQKIQGKLKCGPRAGGGGGVGRKYVSLHVKNVQGFILLVRFSSTAAILLMAEVTMEARILCNVLGTMKTLDLYSSRLHRVSDISRHLKYNQSIHSNK